MSWWNLGETLSSHLLWNNKFLASYVSGKQVLAFIITVVIMYFGTILVDIITLAAALYTVLVSEIHEILKNYF